MNFNCHQIEHFATSPRRTQLFITIRGDDAYYPVLQDAFRQFRFTNVFPDRLRQEYWAFYVHNIGTEEAQPLIKLLQLLKEVVFIEDALDQTFALDYHWLPGYDAGRTEIGTLVHHSKPYKNPVNETHKQNARALATQFAEFIQAHPSYQQADYIVSVSSKGKSFDLPFFIAGYLSNTLKIKSGQQFVSKIKNTGSMKDLDVTERIEKIQDAFEVKADHPFKGKTVILIDDLYDTGSTLHEMGTLLQRAGAKVLGLVATKTSKGR